jgi:hypothetical protein
VRCGATTRLEFHHRVPFAEGGASSVANLLVACAQHNKMEAARWFNCDQAELHTWEVPDGDRITRVEGEISGDYITRLQFFAERGRPSQLFGEKRGKPFVATDPGKGALRTELKHEFAQVKVK